MKISILIPVYNFDVKSLVEALYTQCTQVHNLADFEILVYEDGSKETFENAGLQHEKIRYVALPQNIGRSAIRNKLAADARFEALLFLDCDSAIRKQDFIKAYVQHYQDEVVVYGGRTYDEQEPSDEVFFRWKYGVEREIIPADDRILHPYRSFMTNNFLITKSVFLKLKLDESLKGYGHEDTLFGLELEQNEIPIIHIDNPAVHIGLESTEEFLNKTKEGIGNLVHLYQKKKIKPQDVKLLSYYAKFKFFPLKQLFNIYYRKNEQKILDNMHSKEVKVYYFDLFKLYHILNLNS